MTRTTKETSITMTLWTQKTVIETPLPFFNHMLTAMFFYAGIPVELHATGDVEVDDHHLVEDVGIVLGKLLREYLDSNLNVMRFGYAYIPMDESLSRAVIDLSNRPTLVYTASFTNEKVGTLTLQNVKEFFKAFANEARITLHIENVYGENDHHRVESMFKAVGKALKQSLQSSYELQSTKGQL